MNNMDNNYRSCPYYPTNRQSKSTNYSYLPAATAAAPPPPLMTMQIIPPPTLSNTTSQERQSETRSVKKTKLNEGTEQKTQYLETMLRMPQQQQKTSTNSLTFDRRRFANDQISFPSSTIENSKNDNLEQSSFHLINNHDDISVLEELLSDHQFQSTSQIIDSSSTLQTNSKNGNFSGFLIDNCDEEDVLPISPPRPPVLNLPIEEPIQENQEVRNEQCMILVNELDAADAEQRQALKRQKRFHKRLQKIKNRSIINKSNTITTVNNNSNHHELSSDWIIEHDITSTASLSQLTNVIKKTTAKTTTDEDKISKVNLILRKIKKQQKDLKRLRQYVISIFDEEQKQNSHDNQDLLMTFLNQPILSGCWLCSGKRYTEISTQCPNFDHRY